MERLNAVEPCGTCEYNLMLLKTRHIMYVPETCDLCRDGMCPVFDDRISRAALLKRLFPMGIPKSRYEWDYAINARAVYEAIMKR